MPDNTCVLLYPGDIEPTALAAFLRETITSEGYDLYDWAAQSHAGDSLRPLCDKIRTSRRVVVVMDDRQRALRENLFYELGLAHGMLSLDRVIPVVSESNVDSLPHYLKIVEHLVYVGANDKNFAGPREELKRMLHSADDREQRDALSASAERYLSLLDGGGPFVVERASLRDHANALRKAVAERRAFGVDEEVAALRFARSVCSSAAAACGIGDEPARACRLRRAAFLKRAMAELARVKASADSDAGDRFIGKCKDSRSRILQARNDLDRAVLLGDRTRTASLAVLAGTAASALAWPLLRIDDAGHPRLAGLLVSSFAAAVARARGTIRTSAAAVILGSLVATAVSAWLRSLDGATTPQIAESVRRTGMHAGFIVAVIALRRSSPLRAVQFLKFTFSWRWCAFSLALLTYALIGAAATRSADPTAAATPPTSTAPAAAPSTAEDRANLDGWWAAISAELSRGRANGMGADWVQRGLIAAMALAAIGFSLHLARVLRWRPSVADA